MPSAPKMPGSQERWKCVGSLAVVNRLDILRGKVAHVSMATAPPAQCVGAVNELDDVSPQEA